MPARSFNTIQANEFFGGVPPYQYGVTGAAPVPNINNGTSQIFTLNAATVTLGVPTGTPAIGTAVNFVLLQDATGGRAVAFNAIYKNAPTLTGSGANTRALVEFKYDGVNYQYTGGAAAFT